MDDQDTTNEYLKGISERGHWESGNMSNLLPATPLQAVQATKLRSLYEERRRSLESFRRDLLEAADDNVKLQDMSERYGLT